MHLRKNDLIDEIAVVVNEHYIFMIEDMIVKTNGENVKRILVESERYHSSQQQLRLMLILKSLI
jgi:2-C-methyl-D-erythritol 4-phosphate cytidylyltransferase